MSVRLAELTGFVAAAAGDGLPARELERGLWPRLLSLGYVQDKIFKAQYGFQTVEKTPPDGGQGLHGTSPQALCRRFFHDDQPSKSARRCQVLRNRSPVARA
ncbi:MAG: hypothetical protein H6953_18650 [Chromatiaceae bacterium]|nr:hypothetical protein [Chromatiaceae bacterium]